MSNKIIPPATRKEEMVMPSRESNSRPVQRVMSMMQRMAIPLVSATLRLAAREDLRVSSKKIDNEPRGFIMMIIAAMNFTASAVVTAVPQLIKIKSAKCIESSAYDNEFTSATPGLQLRINLSYNAVPS